MKKLFLTSGLVLCMACPAYATEVDGQGNECVQSVLGVYEGGVDLEAHWTKNKYDITYEAGAHGTLTGTGVFEDDAEYDSSYTLRGLGTGEGKSGVTTNTGYHFTGWLGSSTATGYTPATYTETQNISPFQVAGPLTLTAQWTHNVSGDITLHSDVYADNTGFGSATPKYTTTGDGEKVTTAASPTPLYNAYDIGLFSSSTAAANAVAGTTTPLASITIPVKAGYAFGGFYDGNTQWIAGDGTVNTDAIKALIATENTGQTKELYAHWTPVTYNIKYYGGTAKTQYASHTLDNTTGITDSATYDAGYTVKANTDATLANGGLGTPFSQTGYHFTGWRADKVMATGDAATALGADFTTGGQEYVLPASITAYKVVGATNLYAQWAPDTYNVVYHAGDHSSSSDHTDTNGATYDSPYAAKTYAQAGMTASPGYTFAGWSTVEHPTVTNNVVSNAFVDYTTTNLWDRTTALNLYAAYTANQYTITYNCGGPATGSASGSATGTNLTPSTATDTVTMDGGYTLAASTNCALSGYEFVGWACVDEVDAVLTGGTASNTVDYTGFHGEVSPAQKVFKAGAEGTFQNAKNVTCTAKWKQNKIDLTWYKDVAGTADVNTKITVTGTAAADCTYDNGITLPSTPNKTGYTFNGWHVRGVTAPAQGE